MTTYLRATVAQVCDGFSRPSSNPPGGFSMRRVLVLGILWILPVLVQSQEENEWDVVPAPEAAEQSYQNIQILKGIPCG